MQQKLFPELYFININRKNAIDEKKNTRRGTTP